MAIERRPQHFPRASGSTTVDRLVIRPGDHPAFAEMFAALPTCERIELDSFLAGPDERYFEDVTLYFSDAEHPGEPFSPHEFTPGSETREAIDDALERFDAQYAPPA